VIGASTLRGSAMRAAAAFLSRFYHALGVASAIQNPLTIKKNDRIKL
jgi:hypothetical protein